MSLPLIGREVSMMLSQAKEHIAQAETKLVEGSLREKVKAAGELAFLKRQRAVVEERLKEIEAQPDATETLLQWIKEEVFNLNFRLENWIARG